MNDIWRRKLRLTQFTDYALRTLIFLASNDKELQSVMAISQTYSMPNSTVMKIVSQLVRLNYVESFRGRFGGIRLAVPAKEISLGAVIRSIEESFEMAECSSCVLSSRCKLKGILSEAVDAFMIVLEKYTLDDLINEETGTATIINALLPEQSSACPSIINC